LKQLSKRLVHGERCQSGTQSPGVLWELIRSGSEGETRLGQGRQEAWEEEKAKERSN